MERKIEGIINELIDYYNRFASTNPFVTFEFEIQKGLNIIGKTIPKAKFWKSTSATIIGIRRRGNLILSPGPYAIFEEGDIFVAIGDEESYYRIKKFLYEGDKE